MLDLSFFHLFSQKENEEMCSTPPAILRGSAVNIQHYSVLLEHAHCRDDSLHLPNFIIVCTMTWRAQPF